MRKIDIIELKQIQLSILDDVDLFCRNNDIKYSLSSGTLIGCIRHGGYVPWDDDIDIYMLRDDYERFIHTYNSVVKKTRVISLVTEEKYSFAYSKVEDIRTRLIEKIDIDDVYGVNIDVFPIDGVPDDFNDRRVYFRHLKLLYKMSLMKYISVSWQGRSFFKNLLLLLSKVLFCFFTMRDFSKKLDDEIDKKLTSTCSVCNLTCGNNESMSFPRNCMKSYSDMQFEDRRYMVMDGYHEYLTKTYGNYMQLPPEAKRVSHHVFEAYWKE